MKLELHRHRIENIEFGPSTRIGNRTLFISKNELVSVIREASGLTADVRICRPGEKTRITNILDIVEPRAKADGTGDVFPGFLGASEKAGNGVTKILEGAAVVEVAAIPRVQEGVIDMSGNGAQYSPFSRTQNVVLCFTPDSGMQSAEVDRCIRLAGLNASAYLAQTCLGKAPDEIDTFDLNLDQSGHLPKSEFQRIAYICLLQSQGFLRETFVYGNSTEKRSFEVSKSHKPLLYMKFSGQRFFASRKDSRLRMTKIMTFWTTPFTP